MSKYLRAMKLLAKTNLERVRDNASRSSARMIRISNILAVTVLALCPHQAVFAAPPASPAPLTFAVGDELQVSFYEPFNNDAKWAAVGQVREPGPSFYLHDELSGNYTVASDWTIALPVIGNVVVANQNAAQVEAVLDKDFLKVIGHPGFVNISIVARTPLYVLGLVDRPGVYPFKPDMTPLDLIALAGGFKITPQDTQSSIDAINETAHQSAELEQLRNALAQFAVLQANLDNTLPQPPQQLVDLMGKSGADALVQNAQANRKAIVQSEAAQVQALQSAADAAQTTLVADRGRLEPTKDNVTLLQARLSSLKSLSRDGLAAQPEIEAAQAAALASQDRQQDVLATIAADQHQLVLAKAAEQDFISNSAMNLSRQLADQQNSIDNLTPEVAASAEVIRLLTPENAPQNSDNIQFFIVRAGQQIAAGLSTELQPGDVLQVVAAPYAPAATAAPAPQAALPAPSSPQLASSGCPLATGCF